MINDLTYKIFEEVEKRGLQFVIPERWKPLYREFLKERKWRKGYEGYAKDFGGKTP